MKSRGAGRFAARVAFGLAALLAVPAASMAGVITFGDAAVDRLDLAGPQVEGSFTYQAVAGTGWEILALPEFGSPPSALATFFDGENSKAGDAVEIRLTSGGAFSFESVDFRTILTANSDDVLITGFLGGNPTGKLMLTDSQTAFKTVASGFAGLVDLLRVEVAVGGSNSMLLDNFVVNAAEAQVPEPSSLALVLLGLLGLLRAVRLR